MRATVVFVHGAFIWEPEWWWHPVAEILEEHGIASRAPQLPSCGKVPPLGDLHDDARTVREVIDEIEGPVILAAHSYGGLVVTEAAAGNPKVNHLVYMSAFVPDGTSAVASEFTNPDDIQLFDVSEDGTAGEGGSKTHLIDALPNPDYREGAMKRLTRQSVQAGLQPPEGAAWKEIPSTFMLILNDADVAVERQRTHAQRCTEIVEMPTNHFAHLERPDLVAEMLVKIVDRVVGDVPAAEQQAV